MLAVAKPKFQLTYHAVQGPSVKLVYNISRQSQDSPCLLADHLYFISRRHLEPVILPQHQLVYIDIPEHPHIGCHLIIYMRIHKQRRPARRTKIMRAFLHSIYVALHVIFASIEHDLRTLRVDVQVAVLAAEGAVAVGDFLRRKRGGEDFVFDGAAVAVGFVPDFGGDVGVGHSVGFVGFGRNGE